jgi:hypothetical protein
MWGTQTSVFREVIWHRCEAHMLTHTIGKILSQMTMGGIGC